MAMPPHFTMPLGGAARRDEPTDRVSLSSRLAAAESDPVATMLRRRVPDITSEVELLQLWRAWRHATLAALLRGRGAAPAAAGEGDETG